MIAHQKAENQRCASKSPQCSKALTLSGPLFVNRKKSPEAGKMTFSKCSSLLHIYKQDETFLFLPNFHIFSRAEKSWGDQKKRYIERTTNERRTNDERTTWMIIIPRQEETSIFHEIRYAPPLTLVLRFEIGFFRFFRFFQI